MNPCYIRDMPRALVWLAAASLLACASQDYTGTSYAPTGHVDVFYELDAVERPYDEMGVDHVQGPDVLTTEKLVEEIVAQAKLHGADAVVIQGLPMKDGKPQEIRSAAMTYHQQRAGDRQMDQKVTARFLKYRSE